jgi:phage recombination protein Bet
MISAEPQSRSLVAKFAERFAIDPKALLPTLKATAFRQGGESPKEITNEQMAALLIVADQYKLNPFTKELFAFPDKGGIVPVVSVDGWARIINEHPQMDGMDFLESDEMVEFAAKQVPAWIECLIYRKDRSHPTKVRERFSEVRRDTAPWKSHPSRMLRHKSLIQCARLAFGFAGIYDQDEAERIIERDMGAVETVATRPAPRRKSMAEQPPIEAQSLDAPAGAEPFDPAPAS